MSNENGQTEMAQWKDLLLKEETIQGLVNRGYYNPSEIQYHAVPYIMKNRNKDIICQAKSGMGKTALFLISVLERM